MHWDRVKRNEMKRHPVKPSPDSSVALLLQNDDFNSASLKEAPALTPYRHSDEALAEEESGEKQRNDETSSELFTRLFFGLRPHQSDEAD